MPTETLSLRISKAEIRALRAKARHERISQGSLVRRALRAYGQSDRWRPTARGYDAVVLLELPDSALSGDLPPETLRLELACALYGRGKLGKLAAAELAGIGLAAFQSALGERGLESYTLDMLAADEQNLRRLFPE